MNRLFAEFPPLSVRAFTPWWFPTILADTVACQLDDERCEFDAWPINSLELKFVELISRLSKANQSLERHRKIAKAAIYLFTLFGGLCLNDRLQVVDWCGFELAKGLSGNSNQRFPNRLQT